MRKIPWPIVIGVLVWWAVNGFIATGQVLSVRTARGMSVELSDVLLVEMVSAALWVPCTLWLLWCTARTPLERERWVLPLAWLSLAILAVVVFRAVALVVLDPWVGFPSSPPRWGDLLLASMLRNFLLGCLIVGVGHALVYAQRARSRERQAQALQEQLVRARLDALSAQLNPHFLFNTLNSISEMVHHDADAADRMLVQLGGLLRHSLEAGRQQHTTLHDELEVLACYLGIEQIRLGDRLRFRREIASDVLYARVPRLMLQPLVENAITHAVAHRASPSTVSVRAWREGPQLLLEVSDEGAGAPARPGCGVGLANTRERLECLYGQAQSLQVAPLPEGGTRVRVSLPLSLDASDE